MPLHPVRVRYDSPLNYGYLIFIRFSGRCTVTTNYIEMLEITKEDVLLSGIIMRFVLPASQILSPKRLQYLPCPLPPNTTVSPAKAAIQYALFQIFAWASTDISGCVSPMRSRAEFSGRTLFATCGGYVREREDEENQCNVAWIVHT